MDPMWYFTWEGDLHLPDPDMQAYFSNVRWHYAKTKCAKRTVYQNMLHNVYLDGILRWPSVSQCADVVRTVWRWYTVYITHKTAVAVPYTVENGTMTSLRGNLKGKTPTTLKVEFSMTKAQRTSEQPENMLVPSSVPVPTVGERPANGS